MWEAYGLDNEDFLWASTALRGGIAGQQKATCGAVAGAAVSLGLKNAGSPPEGEAAEKTRQDTNTLAGQLVGDFIREYGAVACIDLLGVDFSEPAAREQAMKDGLFEQKCHKFVQYVVEKLYELEAGDNGPVANP